MTPYDFDFPSLIDAIEYHARVSPECKALSFIDAKGDPETLTFRDISEKIKALAGKLAGQLKPGDRALILHPSGLDYVVALLACSYADVIAVPVNLPGKTRVKRVLQKLTAIATDCEAAAIITGQDILSSSGGDIDKFSRAHELTVIDDSQISRDNARKWRRPDTLSEQSIAFLQYTSGSTGTPKGVINRHDNIAANLAILTCLAPKDQPSVVLSWLPLYHDMGLIKGILYPLYYGNHGVFFHPTRFIADPLLWLEYASEYRATALPCPNFALQACVNAHRANPERLATADLSSIVSITPSAEPVSMTHIENFYHAFRHLGLRRAAIRPCYGLAEATLMVSAHLDPEPLCANLDKKELAQHKAKIHPEFDDQLTSQVVACGHYFGSHKIKIVDPETHRASEANQIGEIWVSGPAVAAGYWHNPKATAHTFEAKIKGAPEDSDNYMRTGDLGFLADGHLYITGRLKDLIIVRGECHYPHDIEATATAAHESAVVNGAAAFARTNDDLGTEAVILVMEGLKSSDAVYCTLADAVRRRVAEQHGIAISQITIIRKGTLPRTSSGKIKRLATSAALEAGQLKVLWQEDPSIPHQGSQKTNQEDPLRPATVMAELAVFCAQILGTITARTIKPAQALSTYGFDSASSIELLGRIKERFHVTLPENTLLEAPTIVSLSEQIIRARGGDAANPAAEDSAGDDDAIAIIGMAFRLPSDSGEDITDEDTLWEFLAAGRSATTPQPSSRFRHDPNKTHFGSFLANPDHFDAEFFSMSAREASNTDPQHRLLLESSWHALESAGQVPAHLRGKEVGVFVGIGTLDYSHIPFISGEDRHLDAYYGTGNAMAASAGRVSFFYGWEGPCMAIDTACSSSHSALHLACQALRNRECELALASAAKLQILPEIDHTLDKAGMLAQDGRCKTFAAEADGYVRGEGIITFVLKPLAAALKAHDPIRAVVRGSLVRQDGASSSLSAPNPDSQLRLLRSVLGRSGLSPADIDYVELHGTGTRLGDPAEYSSVARTFADRDSDKPLLLGSIKSNLGHLEAAAGASGLVKTILCLEKGQIPPHIGYQNLNPLIDLSVIPAELPKRQVPWPHSGDLRRAGVTSYGFTGTIAHIILEHHRVHSAEPTPAENSGEPQLFLLSAASLASLSALQQQWQQAIASFKNLRDLATTLAKKRAHLPFRYAFTAASQEEFARKVTMPRDDVTAKEPLRIGFVFTGQGAQYNQMGVALYQKEPAFAAAFDEVNDAISPLLGRSLKELLFTPSDAAADDINSTAFAQPALFAMGYALAKLWQSYGVQPAAATGHSIGEFAALVIAGCLKLGDACRMIVNRGRMMQELPSGGMMVSVRANEQMVKAQFAKLSAAHREMIAIAAVNGTKDVVISGAEQAMKAMMALMADEKIGYRPLVVSHAFHSPLLEPMLADWQLCCENVPTAAPDFPVISCQSLKPLSADIPSQYWRDHAREPVHFRQAIEQMTERCDTFIEIGPHAILTPLTKRILLAKGETRDTIASQVRGDADQQLLAFREALAKAYMAGLTPKVWPAGTFGGSTHLSPRLPRYPFQTQSHWLDYDADAKRQPGILQPKPPRTGQAPLPLYRLSYEPCEEITPPAFGHIAILGQPKELAAITEVIGGVAHAHQVFADPLASAADWLGFLETSAEHSTALLFSDDSEEPWQLVELAKLLQSKNAQTNIILCAKQSRVQPSPMAAAKAGAARALTLENPQVKWRFATLEPKEDARAFTEQLPLAMALLKDKDSVAIEGDVARYPVLQPMTAAEPDKGQVSLASMAKGQIDPERSYLIIGGTGAIGRHICEWLIARGAKKLYLTSRSEPRYAVQTWLDYQRSRNIAIDTIICDVSEELEVAGLFSDKISDPQSLAGIFHCAGQGVFNSLDSITRKDYDTVTTAKIAGSIWLDKYSRDLDLTWFVLFTSISGIWGSRLQIHYGAANAFQDALIAKRRHQNLTGHAIAWGPWAGGAGMSEVDDELLQTLRMAGIERQLPARYLEALDSILLADHGADAKDGNILAAAIDWRKFIPLYSLYNDAEFFSHCASQAQTEANIEASLDASAFQSLSPAEKDEFLESFVIAEIARTLQLSPSAIGPDSALISLGLDSILVMDFARACSIKLDLDCSLKELFKHSTPAGITAYLKELAADSRQRQPGDNDQQLTITPDLAGRYEPFPLTELQYAYWIGRGEHYALGGVACHAYLEAYAEHGLDIALFERCWNTMIARHDALRLVFDDDGRQRIIADPPHYAIRVYEDCATSFSAYKKHCRALRNELSHQVLDPGQWPLFDIRVSRGPQGGTRLHVSIDMLINDAASSQILWEEMIALYRAGGDLSATALKPYEISFRDFILAKNQQKAAAKEKWQRDEAYWLEKIPTLPAPPALPIVHENLAQVGPKFKRWQTRLSAPEWQAIRDIAKTRGLSAASVLITAFSEVLAAWSTERAFTLNLTIFDRLPWHDDIPRMLGDFTAVTVLPLDLNGSQALGERIGYVNELVLDSLNYRSYSTIDILREMNRGKNRDELASMPVIFTSQLGVNDPTKGADDNPLGDIVYGITQTPQVWLDHQVSEQNGELVYCWDAVENLFHEGVIDDMFAAYGQILTALARSETKWSEALTIPLPKTQRRAREKRNSAQRPANELTLDQLFFRTAREQPQRTCLVTATGRWSYQEMEQWVNGIAQQLVATKVERGDRVAVLMAKGSEQVASCLAILAVGAVYVPLSADTPAERLKAILGGSKIKVITHQPCAAARLPADGCTGILVDEAEPVMAKTSVTVPKSVFDEAYVIYTSGSTGTPKGVLIDHRGACNTVLDINERYKITEHDVVFGLSSLWFDLSVYDMFGTFAAGAALVLPAADEVKNPRAWCQWLEKEGVTVWNSVPALFDLLLTALEPMASAAPADTKLRCVMLSGDWIPLAIPARMAEQLPGAELFAMGGATEASIWSNWYAVKELDPNWKSIPYGYPLSNQSYFVLDSAMVDRPDFVVGDLYIGGQGVALGYENNPEATAASFMSWQGKRIYRTGDLARYHPGGLLEFMGRRDFQVKIAGNRIELGEIETILAEHESTKNVVVDTLTGPNGEKQLGAWLVPSDSRTEFWLELKAEPKRMDGESLALCYQNAQPEAALRPSPEHMTAFWQLMDDIGRRAIADTNVSLAARELPVSPRFAPLVQAWASAVSNAPPSWDELSEEARRLGLEPRVLVKLQGSANLRADIIAGRKDPLELYYGEDQSLAPEQLSHGNPLSPAHVKSMAALIESCAAELPRRINILEIGGRTGVTSTKLLSALATTELNYTFSEGSKDLLLAAEQRLEQAGVAAGHHEVTYALLDIDAAAESWQEFQHKYDLVIAFNALHRAQDIEQLLSNIDSALAPAGQLLAPEMTRNSIFQLATVAMLAQVNDEYRLQPAPEQDGADSSPFLNLLSTTDWQQKLIAAGFTHAHAGESHAESSSGFPLLLAQAKAVKFAFDAEAVKSHLKEYLPGYMIPQRYVVLATLPLSATGKVDRKALPRPKRESGRVAARHEAPRWQGFDQTIATIWAETLGVNQPEPSADFFAMGGDSLSAVRLIEAIRKQTGRAISLQELFAKPVFSAVLALAKSSARDEVGELPFTPDDGANRHVPFPLTDVQQAYWIGRKSGLHLSGVSTHLYVEIDVTIGPMAAIAEAWRQLVTRHDMLRAVIDEHGYQRILEEVPDYDISTTDLRQAGARGRSQWQTEVRQRLSHQVKDTSQWPIFSIEGAILSDEKTRLCISIDNIICDGMSMQILLSEWAQLVSDPTTVLKPISISFRDYVQAKQGWEQHPKWQRALSYWLERMADLPPGPALPLAEAAEPIMTPTFQRIENVLAETKWQAIKNQAKAHGISDNGALLTIWAIILGHWSHQTRFTLNLTLFQRPTVHDDINHLVGDFTSLSLLLCDVGGAMSFAELALKTQQQLWQDLDHAEVSAIRVLREAAKRRGGLQAVSYPIVFTSGLGVAGDGVNEPIALGQHGWSVSQTPQVWIDQQVTEREGKLYYSWDVVDGLFVDGVVDDMFLWFTRLLKALAEDSTAWTTSLRERLPAVHRHEPAMPTAPIRETVVVSSDGPLTSESERHAEWLLAILLELTDIAAPDLHTNFFELGITSLDLIRLHQKLEQKTGQELSVADVFQRPTISALAEWLATLTGSHGVMTVPKPKKTRRSRNAARSRTARKQRKSPRSTSQ